MTLEKYIRSLIRRDGPVSVARYMALALGHPRWGYYMTRDPLGMAGDFTTAPEISQMFGELLGAWCADVWTKLGSPEPFIMAECGPGRGTLMKDMLRVTAGVKGFHEAMQVHLVETSPLLREKQKRALSWFDPQWHGGLDTLPGDAPLILVANEFLDALPVRQFQMTKDGWRERMVGLDGDRLVFVLSEKSGNFPPGDEGDIFEVSPARTSFTAALCGRLKKQKGAALLVDYGHVKTAPGDTLQAVRGHKYADALTEPGLADLTSHVDFESLLRTAQAEGAACFGPVDQGVFLDRLGVGVRVAALLKQAEGTAAESIWAAHARLTAPDQMGRLFKVVALCHHPKIRPEGF